MGIKENAARYVVARGKPTRAEARRKITELVDTAEQDGKLEGFEDHLAFLYAYFMPNGPSKPKTGFEWVAMAVDKDDQRPSMRAVRATDAGELVGTDGHRLHLIRDYGEQDAWYHPNGLEISRPGQEYPDFRRVLPGAPYALNGPMVAPDPAGPDVERIPSKRDEFAVPVKDGSGEVVCKVNTRYLKGALAGFSDPVAWLLPETEGHHARLVITHRDCHPENARRLALIMPLRL